jgi:hypothetical protein
MTSDLKPYSSIDLKAVFIRIYSKILNFPAAAGWNFRDVMMTGNDYE